MIFKVKNYRLTFVLVLLLSTISTYAQETPTTGVQSSCNYVPKVAEMVIWAKDLKNLPKNEKKITGGLGVFKEELYFVDKNIRTIDLFNFDFDKKEWVLATDSTLYHGIVSIYKGKYLPWGIDGIEIVGDTLFTIGIEKNPFTAINLNNEEIIYSPEFELPDYHGSEGPRGIAFSFPVVYLAYQSLDYSQDIVDTQRLFGVDAKSGKILFDTPLNLSKKRKDSVHGLTALNKDVWHIRENKLVQMDGTDGKILNKYILEDIGRPSSICFYKNSFWISTYYGGLYEIPLVCK